MTDRQAEKAMRCSRQYDNPEAAEWDAAINAQTRSTRRSKSGIFAFLGQTQDGCARYCGESRAKGLERLL
ncbi:MAG: hypothetical protein ACXW06_07850 [Halobacteriota archaeon]